MGVYYHNLSPKVDDNKEKKAKGVGSNAVRQISFDDYYETF